MKGHVDSSGRALVSIRVAAQESTARETVQAWVDTGFTGDLVFPQAAINRMKLEVSGSVEGILADGTLVRLPKYECWVDWFDENRLVEVVANDGEYALLGVSLLIGRELSVDYARMTVVIE